jgi:hypothetical protein
MLLEGELYARVFGGLINQTSPRNAHGDERGDQGQPALGRNERRGVAAILPVPFSPSTAADQPAGACRA